MKKCTFQAMIMAWGILIPSLGAVGNTIPVADLFDSVPAQDFTLSPDGEYLAFMGLNAEGRMALFARNLESGEIQSWMGYGDSSMIIDYFWISPERLVYQTTGPGAYGDNSRDYIGVYSVRRDSAKVTKLNKKTERMFPMDPLVDRESLLLVRNIGKIDKNSPLTLIEIDGVKGRKLRTHAAFTIDPGIDDRDIQIFLDPSGEIRVLFIHRKGSSQWTYRSSPDAEWIPFGAFEDFRVLGLDPSGKGALVAGHFGNDRSGLYRYDLEKQSVGQLVFKDPTYDLRPSARLVNDVKRRPLGLRYMADRQTTIWFSANMQQVQDLLDQQIPDSVNSIVGADTAHGRFLIKSFSDRQPILYKFLDLEKRSLTTIFETTPKVDPAETAKTDTMKIPSRDGLSLDGFLTRPIDTDPPYPTIVIPRKSARSRVSWGFDPKAQFLAHLGYAVLQINNRGSIGYGRHFSEELLGDLAGMNNDLEDSVKWAIEQGLVDPDRVAIVGSNFGGYAAMYAVATNPGTYRCAIALNGIYDLEGYDTRQARRNVSAGFGDIPISRFGDNPSDDLEFYLQPVLPDTQIVHSAGKFYGDRLEENLRTLSPQNVTDSIKSPVLIVYDPKMTTKLFAKPMIAALKRSGVSYEVFISSTRMNVQTVGTDDKTNQKAASNQEQFYTKIADFLKAHL